MSAGIVVLDEKLHIDYMNPAAEMLFEASSRQLRKKDIAEWFTVPLHELDDIRASISSGHPYTRREAKLMTHAGTDLTVDYSVSSMQADSKNRLILEVQSRDRLIKIEREEELITRQATTQTMIRGMAHEIKNPLGGIRGAAQLLQRELDNEDQHEFTRIIIEEADRLRNLVDRLLGPRQLPKIEEVNIHAIVERVCSLISAETDGAIRIIRDYDPSIPDFQGDAEQLIQAVLNIMRNAMQALEASGTENPEIYLKTRTLRKMTLGAERFRLVCCLQIIDNGPGIPEELVDQIFYPMVSGRAEGSGLGLSIAQSVINQHKGLVECNSRPGQTSFDLYIPLESNYESAN